MPDLVVQPSPTIALGVTPPEQVILQVSSPTDLSLTVEAVPDLSVVVQPPPVINLNLSNGQGPAGTTVSTYETISKNLRSSDFELIWDNGVLTAIEYADGKRKEFNYALTGELSVITLFNESNVVIGVKSLSYVDGELTSVVYA